MPTIRPTKAGQAAKALSVEYLPLQTLKSNPNNARAHSRRQLKGLAASIREFGFVVPVLIDRQSNLIAGHGRLAAAEILGLEVIPCIRVEHLSETQKRAFMLADNRLAEMATWNSELLASELQFLTDTDFDIGLTGFELADPELVIEDADGTGKSDPADQIPALLTHLPPVTRPGDLWILEGHRVFCGDCHQTPVVRTGARWRQSPGRLYRHAGAERFGQSIKWRGGIHSFTHDDVGARRGIVGGGCSPFRMRGLAAFG